MRTGVYSLSSGDVMMALMTHWSPASLSVFMNHEFLVAPADVTWVILTAGRTDIIQSFCLELVSSLYTFFLNVEVCPPHAHPLHVLVKLMHSLALCTVLCVVIFKKKCLIQFIFLPHFNTYFYRHQWKSRDGTHRLLRMNVDTETLFIEMKSVSHSF